jgi:hypothetical protein
VLQPLNRGVAALTWTVKEPGLAVVLKETLVVDGEPVTLPSGSLEVNVIELGVTLPLLTFASSGKGPNARTASASSANRVINILISTLFRSNRGNLHRFLGLCCMVRERLDAEASGNAPLRHMRGVVERSGSRRTALTACCWG